MRKQLLSNALTFILVVCAVGTAQAKSWRINNNTSLKPHFTDINAAMSSDEVQDGDTLYLDPGCTLSSAQTVSKAVTVVGTGYLLDALPYNQASVTGNLTIKAENCKVMGLALATVVVQANNITIERCSANQISGNSYQHATIRSCYVSGSVYGSAVAVINTGAYWIVENCIVINTYGGSYTYNNSVALRGVSGSIIRNNYIAHRGDYGDVYSLSCSDCEVTNNIILNTYSSKANNCLSTIANSTLTNNVLSCSSKSEFPNNKFNATTGTVFVSSGSNDLAYKLSSTSPAKGYATDGGDCGPYGSGYTYVPSGLPFGHPYYTQIQVGSPAQNGKLNVTYKVKVQDE